MLIGVPVPEDEERNRRPDVCFVSTSNCWQPPSRKTPTPTRGSVVPELAVEVTSPTDRAEDQREKVLEYLRLGVRCVWVVYPRLRIVDVYESSGTVRTFGPDGILPGDPVLPGFEVNLAELFRPIVARRRGYEKRPARHPVVTTAIAAGSELSGFDLGPTRSRCRPFSLLLTLISRRRRRWR